MKDPRDGLKLRLGYEVAREIERTPIISLGVQDAAVKAINSVLYQRLQDQIVDDNPTAQILEERIRDINITNIASENNINKADLIAVLQSGGFHPREGPPGPPGDKGDWRSGSIIRPIRRIWIRWEAWAIRRTCHWKRNVTLQR